LLKAGLEVQDWKIINAALRVLHKENRCNGISKIFGKEEVEDQACQDNSQWCFPSLLFKQQLHDFASCHQLSTINLRRV